MRIKTLQIYEAISICASTLFLALAFGLFACENDLHNLYSVFLCLCIISMFVSLFFQVKASSKKLVVGAIVCHPGDESNQWVVHKFVRNRPILIPREDYERLLDEMDHLSIIPEKEEDWQRIL